MSLKAAGLEVHHDSGVADRAWRQVTIRRSVVVELGRGQSKLDWRLLEHQPSLKVAEPIGGIHLTIASRRGVTIVTTRPNSCKQRTITTQRESENSQAVMPSE